MKYELGTLNKALIGLSHRQMRKEDEYAYDFWEECEYIKKVFVKSMFSSDEDEATIPRYEFTDLGKKYIAEIDPPPPRNTIQKNRIE